MQCVTHVKWLVKFEVKVRLLKTVCPIIKVGHRDIFSISGLLNFHGISLVLSDQGLPKFVYGHIY